MSQCQIAQSTTEPAQTVWAVKKYFILLKIETSKPTVPDIQASRETVGVLEVIRTE